MGLILSWLLSTFSRLCVDVGLHWFISSNSIYFELRLALGATEVGVSGLVLLIALFVSFFSLSYISEDSSSLRLHYITILFVIRILILVCRKSQVRMIFG